MGDGIARRQVLLGHSDQDRSYTYAICDPPYLPLENYVSTIRVTPVIESGKAFVKWSATFDCAADERTRWVNFFENDGFAKWLGALRELMTQGEVTSGPASTPVMPDRIMQLTGGYGGPMRACVGFDVCHQHADAHGSRRDFLARRDHVLA
jgi:hypothetical protein